MLKNKSVPSFSKLKTELIEAVQRNRAEGLLLSGGLDSSILAAVNPRIKAITVSLRLGADDVIYSNSTADFLNMEHFHRKVDIEEALEAIPEVIKILKTFDPAIPNDLAVYFGLKQAKELGISEIMTGDGGDELFAGYDFMQEIDNLKGYIEKITQKMEFSSNTLGEFFKIKIVQPFLDRKFIDFSLGISPEFKIRRHNGKLWGKWILRKAFEDFLPEKILWQDKRPLEYGSGMNKLRRIISDRITDEEFEENKGRVKFMNKEHFYYYRIYIKEVGQIPAPAEGQKPCLGCGAGMDIGAFHCKVCGNVYPIP